MGIRIRAAVLSAVLAVAGLLAVTAPAAADDASPSPAQTCDLGVANAVGYSALMLYVGVRLDGCDNSVMEVWVELQQGPASEGPYTTVDTRGAYSGGAAWFDEGHGCGYYIGVAHWEDQVEVTPRPVWYCI